MSESWLSTSFPERLFVMGAGPSLEILYEHRHEANDWGDWAILRSDLVQPLLEFIEPKYTIRYNSNARDRNKTYGIPIEIGPPDEWIPTQNIGEGGVSSIQAFIYQFQNNGGKELFLFGFDGDSSGYWGKEKCPMNLVISKDCEYMNRCSSQILVKLFHIGETRHKTMKQISIDDLKRTYLSTWTKLKVFFKKLKGNYLNA
tara:strand:+ start:872 stop:1474 length:603 start_codon:yes stop_codon:yes gene_type:complete